MMLFGVYKAPILRSLRTFSSRPANLGVAMNFILEKKRFTGLNSCVLRFKIPNEAGDLSSLPVPSGVKLVLNGQEKSYSPVSLPSEVDYMDILVKPYAPVTGGGFGAFLCDLNIGDTAPMKVKPPRSIHGSKETIVRRYGMVALVGGGTGVAPLIQIAKAELLSNSVTPVRFLSVNQGVEDILMKQELLIME